MISIHKKEFIWWVTEVNQGSLVILEVRGNLEMQVTLLWKSRE
jgi:hypothetical protein